MSLIPYTSQHGQIVLRHGNAVVALDPQSEQLTPRHARKSSDEFNECPLCHRTFAEQQDAYRTRKASETDHAFVNPDYFRLLQDRAYSKTNSASTSPSGRNLRALRSAELSSEGVSTRLAVNDANAGETSTADVQDHSIKNTSFLPGYFAQFFVERGILGRGGRGIVMLVEHVLDGVNLGQFACKRIPVGNDHDWLAKVLVEVQLLQRLIHPNLVSYRHVWLEDAQTTKFGPRVPCAFILQQYCNSGDLHDYVLNTSKRQASTANKHRKNTTVSLVLRSPSPYMGLDEIFSFFRDITAGLHHLHSSGYVHRDLKPQNCLLNADGQRMNVLVSDFGEMQSDTVQRSSTGSTGTISYCAPEVLRIDPATKTYGNFTKSSDIFSLGMILYYMCFGDLPYINADIKEENEDLDLLRVEITSWPGFDDLEKKRNDLPEKLYRFMKRLLSIDPRKRPATSEILQSMQSGSDLHDLTNPAPTRLRTSSRVSPIGGNDQPVSPRQTFSQNHTRPVSEIRRHSSHSKQTPKSLELQEGYTDLRAPDFEDVITDTDEVVTTPLAQALDDESSRVDTITLADRRHKSSLTKQPLPSPTKLLLDSPARNQNTLNPTTFGVILRPFVQGNSLTRLSRIILVTAKIMFVLIPCLPYAAHPLSMGLILFSTIDSILDLSLKMTAITTFVHIIIWIFMFRINSLCMNNDSI